MSDYEEKKARKKREKLEKKLTQSEGKRQSQLSRTGSAYFSSAKSPSSDGVVSSQKSDSSSKLKRLTSISSRNLSPSSFRKNAATSSSSLANSNLSASSSNLASPATERRGSGTSKQGGSSIGGAATKKLRRLSASFDPRKGFSMGGSSRTLKMDRSATFTDDEDDSGMSDSEGGPASSEAMLAKYLPFLAPVATKVVAQAMATDARSAAADSSPSSSSPSSAAALASPRVGAGSLPSPRAGFASAPFGVDEDDDPNLPGPLLSLSLSLLSLCDTQEQSFVLCAVLRFYCLSCSCTDIPALLLPSVVYQQQRERQAKRLRMPSSA